jgi:amino acid transporter
LILAFVAVSFTQYARSFWHTMTPGQGQGRAGSLCLFTAMLLFRDIVSVGRLSVLIWIVVVFTAAWIILTGLWHFDRRLAFDFPPGAFHLSPSFWAGLGAATLIATLDYGGYQNICYIAGEVRQPASIIPRSILYSIFGVAVFYSLTSMVIVGVLPWRVAAKSSMVVSDFIEHLHGRRAGSSPLWCCGPRLAACLPLCWASRGCSMPEQPTGNSSHGLRGCIRPNTFLSMLFWLWGECRRCSACSTWNI